MTPEMAEKWAEIQVKAALGEAADAWRKHFGLPDIEIGDVVDLAEDVPGHLSEDGLPYTIRDSDLKVVAVDPPTGLALLSTPWGEHYEAHVNDLIPTSGPPRLDWLPDLRAGDVVHMIEGADNDTGYECSQAAWTVCDVDDWRVARVQGPGAPIEGVHSDHLIRPTITDPVDVARKLVDVGTLPPYTASLRGAAEHTASRARTGGARCLPTHSPDAGMAP